MKRLINAVKNNSSGSSLVEVIVAGVILVLLAVAVNNAISSSSMIFARGNIMIADSKDVAGDIEKDKAAVSTTDNTISIVRAADDSTLESFEGYNEIYNNSSDEESGKTTLKADVSYSVVKMAGQDTGDNTGDSTGDNNQDSYTGDELLASAMLEKCQTLIKDIYAKDATDTTSGLYGVLQDYIDNNPDDKDGIHSASKLQDDLKKNKNSELKTDDLISALYIIYYGNDENNCTVSDDFIDKYNLYTTNKGILYIKPVFYMDSDYTSFSAIITATYEKSTNKYRYVQMVYDPNIKEDLDYDEANYALSSGSGNWWRLPIDEGAVNVNKAEYPSIDQRFGGEGDNERKSPEDSTQVNEVLVDDMQIGYSYQDKSKYYQLGDTFSSASDVLNFITDDGNAYFQLTGVTD